MMMERIRMSMAVIAVTLLFSGGQVRSEDEFTPTDIQKEMLAKSNEYRKKNGRSEQELDAALTAAAQNHAEYMARTRSFSHYSNGGPSGRASRFGWISGVLENIAYGYSSTPSVYTTWYNSDGHRSNMLSGTTHCGFGCAKSSDGTHYWCAVYGTKRRVVTKTEVVTTTTVDKTTSPPKTTTTTTTTTKTRRGWLPIIGKLRHR